MPINIKKTNSFSLHAINKKINGYEFLSALTAFDKSN